MDQIDQHVAINDEPRAPAGTSESFMAELTRAMHETAGRERGRIAEVIGEDARKHLEMAQARAALEADALRRSADDDIEAIEVWSADEIVRIREDADRRKKQRRADLATYLERHAAIIDSEVAGVDFALAEYQATLEAFIEGLLASNDAADIARRAGMLPAAPDLERARAAARAAAIAQYAQADDDDGPGVGVMDPAAMSRLDAVPLAVDPLQAPDEELEVVSVRPAAADQPNATTRLMRVLGQWISASDASAGRRP